MKLTMTYTVTGCMTEDLDEMPDVIEHGFEFEDREHSFDELLEALSCHPYASDTQGVPRWFSDEPQVDMRTGFMTQYSIHPGRDERSQRAWAKACARLRDCWAAPVPA